jgi:hypothetical protein
VLRRYHKKPGELVAFLAAWRPAAEVRAAHGYEVLFAFVDERTDEFTWAFRCDGDPVAAEARFRADPKREALLTLERFVDGHHNAVVRVEAVPAVQ